MLNAWKGFDASTKTVRVWPLGQVRPIEVADCGSVGAIDLWAIQTAIEGVPWAVDWIEAGPTLELDRERTESRSR